MRVLVTGAVGFAGQHACRELLNAGHTVIAADCIAPPAGSDLANDWVALDVCDAAACRRVIQDMEPDGCLHVAGIAFVPNADAAAEKVFQVNTAGTLHILEAAAAVSPHMRILVVTTSEVYGALGTVGDHSILSEDIPLAPRNLYGISKAAADQTALWFAHAKEMPIMTARPSNHTGPGQRPPFVVPAFIARLLALRESGGGTIKVGNLESERRFLDVRDVVRAYRLILEKGHGGEAYNISTEVSTPIGKVLELLADKLAVDCETEVDPAFYRPTDATAALDMRKIREHCGWSVQYDLSSTLDAMIADLSKNAD